MVDLRFGFWETTMHMHSNVWHSLASPSGLRYSGKSEGRRPSRAAVRALRGSVDRDGLKRGRRSLGAPWDRCGSNEQVPIAGTKIRRITCGNV